MDVSVEITLLPFQNEYKEPIKKFIKTLRASKFILLENPMSTQIYGPILSLMPFLTTAIEDSFNEIDAGVVNLKIIKGDRNKYKADF